MTVRMHGAGMRSTREKVRSIRASPGCRFAEAQEWRALRSASSVDSGGAVIIDPEIARQRSGWAAALVPDDELILYFDRPSPLFILLACLPSLASFAVIACVLAILAATAPWVPWSPSGAFGLGTSLALIRLLWQALEWYCRIHVLTDRRVIVRSGVIRVSVYQAMLRDVLQTRLFIRLRERLFGLGTIGFATAGTGGFDAFWVMIPLPHETHRMVSDAIRRYRN